MTYAQEVRAEIQRLKGEVDARYRRLGVLLKEVREKELYLEYGFASFEEWVRVELGFQERKARYLVSLVEGFERAGVTEEEAATIEQSKAAAIAPVLTTENKEEWLEKARTLDTRTLKREVAKAQGRPVSDEPLRPWGVALFPDQRETVETAMRLAGLAAGTDTRGVMLVTICQEFIAEYSHLDGAEPQEAPHAG